MLQGKLTAIFGALLLLGASHTAHAQTNIFNAPTTDALGKDRAYVEFQYQRQINETSANPQTSIYVPRAVVGVGRNVEVGANVTFVNTEGTNRTNAFFSPNVKWRYFEDEKSGVAASGGGVLFTPVNNRAGSDTFGMVYTNVSKKMQMSYGPRVTAGVYGIVGSSDRQFTGPRAGAMVGVEQPFHPRVSFVADWLSGKNGFGYFTPGVSVNLPKSNQVKLGYSFGNSTFAENNRDKNNRYLFVKYGVTF
jgi:hypothetical protein